MLTGDLNAEPYEDSILFLTNASNYREESICQNRDVESVNTSDGELICSSSTELGETKPFMDVWLEYMKQKHGKFKKNGLQVSLDGTVGGGGSESLGYTFPACNPVKRIDFVLARVVSSSNNSLLSVPNFSIVGKAPTRSTGDLFL